MAQFGGVPSWQARQRLALVQGERLGQQVPGLRPLVSAEGFVGPRDQEVEGVDVHCLGGYVEPVAAVDRDEQVLGGVLAKLPAQPVGMSGQHGPGPVRWTVLLEDPATEHGGRQHPARAGEQHGQEGLLLAPSQLQWLLTVPAVQRPQQPKAQPRPAAQRPLSTRWQQRR